MNETNCPYVLIVIEKQWALNPTAEVATKWSKFLTIMAESTKTLRTDVENRTSTDVRLAENVWLLPLSDGLPILGQLAAAATHAELKYKVLAFDKPPKWHGTAILPHPQPEQTQNPLHDTSHPTPEPV